MQNILCDIKLENAYSNGDFVLGCNRLEIFVSYTYYYSK